MSGPGGSPGAGGRGSCRGARLRSASGPAPGPASRDASLPFRPAPGPRLPGLPRLSPPASGPPPLGLRAPRIPPCSFPRRSPSPRVPPPASPPSAFTCCGSGASRPGPCRRVSAAGPQPFPAAATTLSGAARRGAGEQLCPRGGDAASVRSEDTLPLSVRPGKSSRAGARRERAGGRPRGEGSRGRCNGCHVARWISAPAPGPRPLPLRTPTPGSPGCVGPRHGAGPETRAHRCWRLAGSVKRSESRASRGPTAPRGSPGSLRPVALPRGLRGKAGAGPFVRTRGPLLPPV